MQGSIPSGATMSKKLVYKYVKGKTIPKDYCYCPKCKELTLHKLVGYNYDDFERFKCLKCGDIETAEYQ